MKNELDQFIIDREARYGNKIEYITFARFIGQAYKKDYINTSGVIYLINNVFYFEDFEKSANPLFSFGQTPIYKKMEINFDLNKIKSIRGISEKDGKLLCFSSKELNVPELKKGFLSFFSTHILEINVNDKGILLFDITKREEFIEIFNEVKYE